MEIRNTDEKQLIGFWQKIDSRGENKYDSESLLEIPKPLFNFAHMQEWFANWFDSPFYHVLYAHRDHDEAAAFISSLVKQIPLFEGQKVLDLACGKGRHSMELAKHNLHVVGVDLSPQSIACANESTNSQVRFEVHDMRIPFHEKDFDAVLNLFTSFGYFEDENDNLNVLKAAHSCLKPNGYFLIDFLNADFVKTHLKPVYEITQQGIDFKIHKEIRNGWIYKEIHFTQESKKYSFREEVRLFTETELIGMMQQAGFTVLNSWGNYGLEPMNSSSDRCILLAQKK